MLNLLQGAWLILPCSALMICPNKMMKHLANRKAEVPKAKVIIAKHIAEFVTGLSMRRHAPILKAVKIKLKEIHTSPLFFNYTSTANFARNNPDEKIQRVINGMASKIRLQNQGGCHYIEAINEFIAMEASLSSHPLSERQRILETNKSFNITGNLNTVPENKLNK